ncbi:MAG: protein-methionine-sulfoxide reductase catalytic subunit MsrP [Gemmatimonadetes bacterium]|nr:protein-methionine-sulfoxide reductase catalytic subunit MsrP [Gemmatimonadota bacterium]
MPRRQWEIPERQATDEAVYLNRRKFLGRAGLGSIGLLTGCIPEKLLNPADLVDPGDFLAPAEPVPRYPAPLNPSFSTLDRPLTDENIAGIYNNFWEFTDTKRVTEYIDKFEPLPWTVEITGLVEEPKTWDVEDLIGRMDLEERLYRHRCVEAWSMAIPWTGFPMKDLVDLVKPLSSARYVRMTSFFNPEVAQNQWDQPDYPWPYTEGLTMAEATNELTLMVTGIYGHELPKQHGAPIRLVTPWKYGFKGLKSITLIEFTEDQPATFWPTRSPSEYEFFSNVDPDVPHRRWSQAKEEFITDDLDEPEVRKTLLYNGYGEYVAHLYE